MVVKGCQGKWEKHGDRCYLWSDKDMKKTWTDAEEFCQQEGGNLVSVTSEAINEHIYKEKKRRDLSWLWLGGSDQDKEGVWKWSDGSLWEINNWNLGEPSNQTGQHCLSQAFYSLKWNDYNCNAKLNVICSQTLLSGKIYIRSHYFPSTLRFSTA